MSGSGMDQANTITQAAVRIVFILDYFIILYIVQFDCFAKFSVE